MAKRKHVFLLEGGSHREGNKSYKKGDYIRADRDLRKVFPNKFRLIDPELPLPPEDDEQETVTPRVAVADESDTDDEGEVLSNFDIDSELTADEDTAEEEKPKRRRKARR